MKPTQNYILLEDLPKKKSAIILPDDADIEGPSKVKVVTLGDTPLTKAKIGDIVLIKRHNFDEVEEDGQKYLIGEDKFVIAIC